MAEIYYIDFKRKSLIAKRAVQSEPSKTDIEKFEHFKDLISRGLTQVWANSNVNGVKLPADMMGKPSIQLNWSHKFQIPDFEYTSSKISGSLSFNKKNFYVELPWEAIWLIGQSEVGPEATKVWPESAPQSILEEMAKELDGGEIK